MKKLFLFENSLLSLTYAVIAGVKALFGSHKDLGTDLVSAARSLVPAIAFTYVLGERCGIVFHKARHRLENALVL